MEDTSLHHIFGGTNSVPLSLGPSVTFPNPHAQYPGFLMPPGSHPGSVGSSPGRSATSSPLQGGGGRYKEKKKRRRLTSEETRILVEVFERTQKPNGPLRKELAGRLNMTSRAIQIWFQNRRAKVKRDTAGGESESGLETSPPPEETGREYSVGTPMASAPGSSHSTPNHTPAGSAHGTPNTKRSQKFNLAHSVADSLWTKNPKAQQNLKAASPARSALVGSPQLLGGIGIGKNFPLAPRPAPGASGQNYGQVPPVPPVQNYGQAPNSSFASQQPFYAHQQAQPVQPQHQNVLLQLQQQHQQQLQLQQLQQMQISNSADRPGNQQTSTFLLSPTRNVGVDPSRLSRFDAAGDERMDLDVYNMMTGETLPQIATPSYDEYSARVTHPERLSPFLFESNSTYLPSVDPELSSPTTAEFLSTFLTSAERSILAENEPTEMGANQDTEMGATDMFDPFHMFTRGSGDDLNLLHMGTQEGVNSPSGRRRFSMGGNSTHEPDTRPDAPTDYFPRRSRSLAALFDDPLPSGSKPQMHAPNEYWNPEPHPSGYQLQ